MAKLRSINRCTLMGVIQNKPERRSLPSGIIMLSLVVATTHGIGEGQKKEPHKVIAFGELADELCDWTDRGCVVLIEGRIRSRTWIDDFGEHSATEIIAETWAHVDEPHHESSNTPPVGARLFGEDDQRPY